MQDCRRQGVEFQFGARLQQLTPQLAADTQQKDSQHWQLTLSDGRIVTAANVILATGGLSVPKTGSDGHGFEIARGLGIEIEPTYAALTPLVCSPPRHGELAGIALPVRLEAQLAKGRVSAQGALLFTHRGYSGPVVLDISHVAVQSRLRGGERQPIFVRWTELEAADWLDRFQHERRGPVQALLRRELPARLARTLLEEAGVPIDRDLAELRRTERRDLIEQLTRYPLPWTGDEGYKKAEVTGGGVALSEVNPRTLESRRQPGLFFCGEILDVFGPIGGYNFMWAWSTGRAAGLGAAARAGLLA